MGNSFFIFYLSNMRFFILALLLILAPVAQSAERRLGFDMKKEAKKFMRECYGIAKRHGTSFLTCSLKSVKRRARKFMSSFTGGYMKDLMSMVPKSRRTWGWNSFKKAASKVVKKAASAGLKMVCKQGKPIFIKFCTNALNKAADRFKPKVTGECKKLIRFKQAGPVCDDVYKCGRNEIPGVCNDAWGLFDSRVCNKL